MYASCPVIRRTPNWMLNIELLAGTGSLDGEVTGACTNNVIKVKIVDACVLCSLFHFRTGYTYASFSQLPCYTSGELLQDSSIRRGE